MSYEKGKHYKPGREVVRAAVPDSWIGERTYQTAHIERYRLDPPHPLRVVKVNSGGAIGGVWHLNDVVNYPKKGTYRRWLSKNFDDKLRYRALCGYGCGTGVKTLCVFPFSDNKQTWCRECYEYAFHFALLPLFPLTQ
jgi:hypothetical protein